MQGQVQILLILTKQVNVIKWLLNKLQKQICRTVGASLAASVEPLADCRNVAYSVGIILGDVHLNWLNWFTSLFSSEVYSLFW